MKITHLLVSGMLFTSFIAVPALAAEATSSTPVRDNQIKKEIADCRAKTLEKYLSDDQTAWEAFGKAKQAALDAYQSALAKAKETKTKDVKKVARQTLESARKAARDTWQKAHKVAHDTWKTNRAACKSVSVQ